MEKTTMIAICTASGQIGIRTPHPIVLLLPRTYTHTISHSSSFFHLKKKDKRWKRIEGKERKQKDYLCLLITTIFIYSF